MSRAVLYISYDSMLEPLGQSQVLAHLEKLATDHPIHLLSFEKAEDWAHQGEQAATARQMKAAGLRCRPKSYHMRLSSLAAALDRGVR